MFILSLNDEDVSHTLGIFDDEAQILDFLKRMPCVTLDSSGIYVIPKSLIPRFKNLKWKHAIVPLTSYTFSGEIDPYFSWQELSHLPTTHGIVEGETLIDNYIYDNDEVEIEVNLRESLKNALKEHFEKNHKEIFFGGQGSQDGEYLLVDGAFYLHIDPPTLSAWKNSTNVEELLEDIL